MQLRTRFIHTIGAILLSLQIVAQVKPGTYKDYFMEGSYLLLENNVGKAKENFLVAYQLDSSSANINYMVGNCYMQTRLHKDRAEYFLEKACRNVSANYRVDDYTETAAPPIAIFYYGQALHINYKFDEALAQFKKFRGFLDPNDKEFVQAVTRAEEITRVAMEAVAKPINVQITNMGDSINSPYDDYAAVLSADERMMIYTTRRPNSTGGLKTDDDNYYEDIVVSYKDDKDNWSRPVSIGYNVNTMYHEASINLTPDGQTLIVYKLDQNPKIREGDGNIYYTTFDGKEWSTLKDFGSNINSPYQESHACLNADGTLLFFSSERPGGFGGKDIYRCVKLPNGKWSKALNMGPIINTEYDEDGAFIHPDGQTFFFASKGHKSMGGFDIMYATLNEDNKFTNVTNMGYPINTTDDDIFYVTSPDGKRAYMSSAKAGGFGSVDIYKISIAESRESYLALFRGQLIPAEGEKLPDNIVIVVTDKSNNEVVGTYRPKIVNGAFSTILPPGREYNISYQTEDNEEFYNEDVYVSNDMAYQEIRREVALEPVRIGGKVKVKQKAITLNTVVLNSKKQKKAINGAKIILEEVGGAQQFFETDASGKRDGIALLAEKEYKISAEFDGKKSEPADISTKGVKSAKVINQVIYVEGKQDKAMTSGLAMSVQVRSAKSKKPIPQATVTVVGEDGEKVEYVADKDGMIKDIDLGPEAKYEVMAVANGVASEKESFKTGPLGNGQKYDRTLMIDYEPGAIANVYSDLPPSEFEFYYKYNNNVINESDETWKNFIAYISEMSKTGKVIHITIKSSASRVPRRARGGNLALADSRGKKLEAKLRATLIANGVNATKLRFKRSAVVGGPKYQGDWNLGRKKYEAHQYSKAKVY